MADESILPKIGDPKKFAFKQTFIKPIADSLTWRARQLAPKQIAYNILSTNGIGQAALDYKFNLDFAKNPFAGGFTNQAGNAGGPAGAGGGSSGPTTNDPGVVRIITEGLQAGFSNLVRELRSIRQTVMALGRVGMMTGAAGEKTSNKVQELVEIMKGVFGRKKFNDAETDLETKSGPAATAEEQAMKKETGPGLLTTIFGAVGKLLGGGGAIVGAVALFFKDQIIGITRAVFTKIGDSFKNFNLKGFEKLTAPLKKFFTDTFDFFKVIGTKIEPMLGLLGKAKGGLKAIPFVGEVIAIVMAIVDGVTGFVQEYREADGGIIKKTLAGFGGAIKGILVGLLEIPKVIIQGVKWLAEQALKLFGFNELSKKLGNIHFGKAFDSFVENIFKVIGKAFKPAASVLDHVGKIVVDTFKAILYKFIPGAKAFEHLFDGNSANSRLDKKAEEVKKKDDKKDVEAGPSFLDNSITGGLDMLANIREGFGDMMTRAGDSIATSYSSVKESVSQGARVAYTASQELTAKARAFLSAIADKESPDYNTLNGGEKFDDLSDHPRRRGRGGASTAAGRYQFVQATWDEQKAKLNLTSFSPENQDKAAWNLAQERYAKVSGRNLVADLESGDIQWSALAKTWSSLPSGVEQTTSTADVNARYKTHLAREEEREGALRMQDNSRGNTQASTLSAQASLQMTTEKLLKGVARSGNPFQNNISAPTIVNNNVAPAAMRPQTQPNRDAMGLGPRT